MVFQAGVSGNPNGRPKSGMQSMADRIAYWWETKTGDEIERLVRDKNAYRKLVSIDQAVVRRIREAEKKTGIQDMALLLNYMVGKPVQPIAAEFKVTHGLADRIERACKEAGIEIDKSQDQTALAIGTAMQEAVKE